RQPDNEPFDVTIVRDVIRINPVKARLEGDIIYVKIASFSETAHANLVREITSLKKVAGKVRGYIIDLRNDPGGLLNQAIAISDDFLEQGTIVITKGRNAEETQRAFARPGDLAEGKPVVVLINGGSASASEIVAGGAPGEPPAPGGGAGPLRARAGRGLHPPRGRGGLRGDPGRHHKP